MGACFQMAHFHETDAKKLYKKFLDYQEELRYEHGHDSYNGTMSNSNGLNIDTVQLFRTTRGHNENRTVLSESFMGNRGHGAGIGGSYRQRRYPQGQVRGLGG